MVERTYYAKYQLLIQNLFGQRSSGIYMHIHIHSRAQTVDAFWKSLCWKFLDVSSLKVAVVMLVVPVKDYQCS